MKNPIADSIHKRVSVIRTRKYIAVISQDRWGGSEFSPTGWSTYCGRKDATPEWIGENMRKALATSTDYRVELKDDPLISEKFQQARRESGHHNFMFWSKLAEEFGFKDTRTAQSKSAMVFVDWNSDLTDQVRMLASRGRGTGHSAWYEGENDGKVFYVSITVSDRELGLAAIEALDACQPNYA